MRSVRSRPKPPSDEMVSSLSVLCCCCVEVGNGRGNVLASRDQARGGCQLRAV